MDLRALPFAQLNCRKKGKKKQKRKKEKRPLRISELLSFLSSFDVCTRRSELFIGKLKPGISVIFGGIYVRKPLWSITILKGDGKEKKKINAKKL